MSFVTGLLLIDAPASALNNLGKMEGGITDNVTGVKLIRTREGAYPYVSAQAARYWLRRTLEGGPWGWKAAPVFREKKIAYTDANPIRYWDDDLLGYMRAPSQKASALEARKTDATRASETPTAETVTRVSPLRMSTLVSIAPVTPTMDFGVMARQDGDPVPHEHQFYRTTLEGLFSLDLHAAGTFSYRDRSGYLNLDAERINEAEEAKLEKREDLKSFRLPFAERLQRIGALLEALAVLDGGAKLAVHYTDVSPDLLFVAITRGGNHIFGHIVGPDAQNRPTLKIDALRETLRVSGEDVLSPVFVGWVPGYLDSERSRFAAALEDGGELAAQHDRIRLLHPREALRELVQELGRNEQWLD